MGLIKTAIYGGAGIYALNKIMKYREEKQQYQSQGAAPHTSKAFDVQSQENKQHQNGYGYQYQPHPLHFQPVSEQMRGQHVRVDQNGDSYFACPPQRLYLEEGAPRAVFYQQPAGRYQSGFVEEMSEPVNK